MTTVAPKLVAFGPFRFDLPNRLLYKGDEELSLPPRIIDVLAYLIEHADRVVSKDELLDVVWRGVTVEEASLKHAISVLRQTLDDDPQLPRYIKTLHKRGYRFVGEAGVGATTAEQPATAAADSSVRAPATLGPRFPVFVSRWMLVGLALCIAAVIAFALANYWFARNIGLNPASGYISFDITLPADEEVALGNMTSPEIAFSPDGTHLVAAIKVGDSVKLAVRSLSETEMHQVPGSDGADAPFYSPDGQWLGYFSGGKIKTIPTAGGAASVVTDALATDGATWTKDGRIIFGSSRGLFSVPWTGGTPTLLTRVNPERGEAAHLWPEMLPNGAVIFTIWRGILNQSQVALANSESGTYKILAAMGTNPHYLADGHLLVARENDILSFPFSLSRGSIVGPAETAARQVIIDRYMGAAQYAASGGSLAVIHGAAPRANSKIAWVDMSGNMTPTAAPPRAYQNTALSPDGRFIASSIADANSWDIWVTDLTTGEERRVTYDGRNTNARWSRDGKWISYHSSSEPSAVLRVPADGSGKPEVQFSSPSLRSPFLSSMSADGSTLAITDYESGSGADIWLVEADGNVKLIPYLTTSANDRDGIYSPDSKWIAYISDASGQFPGDYQIFIRPASGIGTSLLASHINNSSSKALWIPFVYWASDGKAIFYEDAGKIIRTPVIGGRPYPGKAEALLSGTDLNLTLRGIAPDGKRMLVLVEEPAGSKSEIAVRVLQ